MGYVALPVAVLVVSNFDMWRWIDGRKTYGACCSGIGVRLEKGVDEILGIVADVLPVSLVEDDLGARTLLNQILQVLTAEWRVTT